MNKLSIILLPCIVVLFVSITHAFDIKEHIPKNRKLPSVVDFGSGHREALPPFEILGRVVDLMNGEHFDDILRDTPDEMRPPSLVLFYSHNAPCSQSKLLNNFQQLVETEMPARERLFVAKYNIDAAPFRSWYRFTPEMDLEARFNATNACPTLVYVPRKCNGWTEWCVEERAPGSEIDYVGCKDFKEQCSGVVHYNPTTDGEWVDWANDLIKSEDEPMISPVHQTFKKQGEWLKSRESTTTNTHQRNSQLSPNFPGFTPLGYKAVPIPEPFWNWIQDFYKSYKDTQAVEGWDTTSTQLSFHETQTKFVDLDLVRAKANQMANEYLKPIVEEWTNLPDGLRLTSFYGVRAYPPGSWLRNHIDRVDTHVISLTLSLGKLDDEGNIITEENQSEYKPWPLEFVDWKGEHVRYEHPPKMMMLYESAKGIHGRPYPNLSGWHLGAFCHFEPKSEVGFDWESIARNAKANVNKVTKNVPFRSASSFESDKPVYTKSLIGESHSTKQHKRRNDGSVAIELVNESDERYDVYWVPTNYQPLVFQGTVNSRESLNYESYHGHKFYFTKFGDSDPDTSIKTAGEQYILSVPNDTSKFGRVTLTFDPENTPTCEQD